MNRQKYEKYYRSNHFKALLSSVLSIFLVFFILGLINYLAFKHPLYWDFTKNQVNSLSKQSENVLSQIDGEVIFNVFATRANAKPLLDFVELYRSKNSKIKGNYVDIELRPEVVAQYNITTPNSVVLEYQEKRITVQSIDEGAITNALIRLTRSKDPLICYSVGHEEGNLKDDIGGGLSMLAQALADNYYKVNEINLATAEVIPSEVDILMLWGSHSGFLNNEISMIDQYLKRGGKLLVAIDPNPNQDGAGPLRELLVQWGINVSNDLVVDKIEHISGSNGTVPLIKNFSKEHKITKNFEGQVFFPLVSSVAAITTIKAGSFESFAFSSEYPASWGDTNLNELFEGKIAFNEGVDKKGPISVAASWEEATNSDKKARIVAFGNSTFVINSYSKFSGNFQILLNALSWLVDEGEVYSSVISGENSNKVIIGNSAMGIIFYVSVLLSPIVCFGLAFIIYTRRRKL